MWRKVPLLTGSMPRWRWRKMRIPSLIWILHLMNLTKGQDNTKLLRHRRKYSSLTRHFHLSNTVVRHDSWEMCLIFPLFSPVEGSIQWTDTTYGDNKCVLSAFREQCGHRFPSVLHTCTLRIWKLGSLCWLWSHKSKLPVKLRTVNGAQSTSVFHFICMSTGRI